MGQDLKLRTKKFAVACWKFCAGLPKAKEFDHCTRQLIRCSSSVGANYRAAIRAKSTADFINKLKIIEEEADEFIYWLELIQEVQPTETKEAIHLLHEANELLAIIVSPIKTARGKSNKCP